MIEALFFYKILQNKLQERGNHMGFDLIGIKPIHKKGEYFRNTVWYWRPLWGYVQQELGILSEKEFEGGEFNDGCLISGEKAKIIAEKLIQLIDKGEVTKYIEKRRKWIESLPDEVCKFCCGSGKRGTDHICGQGPCNLCDGTGKVRPWISYYPMDIENMKEFAEFCKYSGGFEIW
jgi:hypothetical protein